MKHIEKKIERILEDIKASIVIHEIEINDFKIEEKFNSSGEVVFEINKTIIIPEEFREKYVVLNIESKTPQHFSITPPQFWLYIDDELIHGLDINHHQTLLQKSGEPGKVIYIKLVSFAGFKEADMFLKGSIQSVNKTCESLFYDINVPLQAAKFLEDDDIRKIDILSCLDRAVNFLDIRTPNSKEFNLSIENTIKYLDDNFYKKLCGKEDILAHCVGHTHIDVAWKWTLSTTKKKVMASFSTILSLMKEYPEFTFMSSQPQLYEFLKTENPNLYKKIKNEIANGRWEVEGGMWLEADCNLTSGESLVRQFLFGTRFFKEEFGMDNKILWLPDVFGYSAALPQIMKKCGIEYFMTTKLSWNDHNKMPFDTFNWKGIDGTEVLTHFITTTDPDMKDIAPFYTSYNGVIEPEQIMGAWDRYQQKSVNRDVLVCYGYGDGGGGPTREMLENEKRMSRGIPGCPRTVKGKALDYFKKIKENHKNEFPKWVGELYLEFHRGTYTSMAKSKRYNRKSEFLMLDVEFFSTLAKQFDKEYKYEKNRINENWKKVLLNQFHDILPGSSIKEVYDDSFKQYEEVKADVEALIDSAIEVIKNKVTTKTNSYIVFNQLGFERTEEVEIEIQGTSEKHVFTAKNVPAKGYKIFEMKQNKIPDGSEVRTCGLLAGGLLVSKNLLENELIRVKFDKNAEIISIYDKINNREVITSGEHANRIVAFQDKPFEYDAWNIEPYYEDKKWVINRLDSVEIIENGLNRAALKVVRTYENSIIEQKISITKNSSKIRFETKIDWHEKHTLLKTSFPVDINSDKATFEIQYGNVERPTHRNTSWDSARFEVCAHKWVDLSEGNYGVSLLNDCKYGHDIKENNIRLTLLKSSTYPNPEADQGIHEFIYELYPHIGTWKEARTVNEAYSLNCPMIVRPLKIGEVKSSNEFSLFSIDKDVVQIEVVKIAEDSDSIIIRVYEYFNSRNLVKLTSDKKIKSVFECDLLEKEISEIKVEENENSFYFHIMPFEIKTFKLDLS